MDDQSPLESLAEVNPRSPSARIGESISFVAMADVSERGYLESVHVRPASPGYTSFVEGDVLLAKITPCMENGKGAHVRELPVPQGQGSTEFHVLRARPGTSDRFLYHLTRTESFRLRAEAMMTGSAGQRRVPREFFSKYVVRVPPLDEQRRIAEILDTIDETIQATEHIIAKRLLLADGALVQALREWVSLARPFASLCTSITVGVVSSATHAYVSDGVPFVRSQNVRPGRIETGDMLKVMPAFVEQHRSTRLELGDVLIVRTGYPGTAAVVTADLVGGSCFSLLVARPDRSLLDPNFLVAFLNTEAAKRQVSAMQFGSAQHNLNVGQVRALQVPCPSIVDQHTFVGLRDELSAIVSTEQAVLSKLRQTRAGLADDLLSGRVRTVAA